MEDATATMAGKRSFVRTTPLNTSNWMLNTPQEASSARPQKGSQPSGSPRH